MLYGTRGNVKWEKYQNGFSQKFMVKKQNNRKDDKDKIENESQSK